MRRLLPAEAGFSLVEILIAIVIVAVTFTAILGGLMTSITVSALHRNQATADTLARNAAEWVKDDVRSPYQNCAGTGTYNSDLTSLAKPAGFAVSVTSVKYWDGSSSNPIAYETASCVDHGLQAITVVAISTDPNSSATETVEILKRTVT